MNRSLTLILKLTNKLAFNFNTTNCHWNSETGNPRHGPQVWPWWLLFSMSLIKLEVCTPSTGRRLWVYTRWGALYADFILDRRGVVTKRFQYSVFKWS